ncbi:leucyl-trna synthetase [Ophiostoma piceae UAMH 11346]|uniref:leucine--tRNA ligase n=1 Tax=Ophiostoma piceae (strain UAMH 11346) TaxID=1262450 RepID=S3CCN9_OPHP1|nr:leucyl-trna synthetase [Ophiostoma piceae UAMH 11346]
MEDTKVVGSERTLKLENPTQVAVRRANIVFSQDEIRFQDEWAKAKLFEQDAPLPTDPAQDKLFTTMAYPYMNGSLHAGHCFTFSKVEFMTGFARMEGRRALLPQGFHCTGMPIKAAADKLKREVEMFGQNFETADVDEVLALRPAASAVEAAPAAPAPEVAAAGKTDMGKFSSNKSKAVAKTGKAKYQFQIMLSLGFPIEEIHRFTDPEHWLQIFPERCETDLRRMGARVDWRRSFVTTPANLYYDSFVRWQMNRLREAGKIKFGKRYTVYSPKDGQACLDHDRSSGEGITVQEYSAIKMKALQWSDKAKAVIGDSLPADADVFFIPATLRPETMYGQICCFVGPTVAYGIYKAPTGKDGKDEYFFCTERAARNMAFQKILPWGKFESVVQLLGADVVGTLVNAPMSVYEKVYILPMQSLKPTKGTGVVACVPSDSPDDYATLLELQRKPAYYNIDPKWLDKEILPIIQTPSSNLIAKFLVEQLKINSPKDAKLLEQAKEQAYKEGFYQGTMLFGEFKGTPVQDAKPLIRKQLVDANLAFNYAEPDGEVISRSADVCVAAYLDQWYLNYGTTENGGDGEWCNEVVEALEDGTVNCFYNEAKHAFEQTLNWLGHWACSRSYGLGTKLPWDLTQLVESLSDSTVYMAYYTVCLYLHGDIFGKTPGKASKPIAPEQMTDEVWDYIFFRTDTVETDIAKVDLAGMRREFEYFYPLDARISGKDLINNHLTFCLYHHAALFPKKFWPRGIRVNGHLLVNGQKMSKSTGNFLTLREATEKFGADATRVALADAGDGIEDANFEETVANAMILRLYELRKWAQETLAGGNLRTGELGLFDKMFENEMNTLVIETKKHYQATFFKLALKSGFYDFVASRDWYRDITKASGDGMHHDLVKRFVELQALLLTPIAPHFSEYLWRDVLQHEDSIQNALYPTVPAPDPSLTAARNYIRNTSSSITAAEAQQAKKMAKGKAITFDPKQPKKLTVFVSQAFPEWQDKCIEVVKQVLEATPNGTVDVKAVSAKLDKAELKKSMPFIQTLKKRIDGGEDAAAVFNRKLSFDEMATLETMIPGLKQMVNKLQDVVIVSVKPGATSGEVYKTGAVVDPLPQPAAASTPGSPSFFFENAA